jgi:hypothetical protein
MNSYIEIVASYVMNKREVLIIDGSAGIETFHVSERVSIDVPHAGVSAPLERNVIYKKRIDVVGKNRKKLLSFRNFRYESFVQCVEGRRGKHHKR